VSGAFSVGGNTGFPQGRREPLVQVADNFTLIRSGGRAGDHALKLGANVKMFRSDSYFDADSRGTFTFFSLQQFIAGQPGLFTQFRGDTRLERPNTLAGFYVQDDWRPRADLTFNVGLRYDYESAKTEALREISGAPGPGISSDKNNFAPRVGVVWAPGASHKQAIHAGAGIYYDQIVLNILRQRQVHATEGDWRGDLEPVVSRPDIRAREHTPSSRSDHRSGSDDAVQPEYVDWLQARARDQPRARCQLRV
jgi:hypothetical protein